MLSGIFLYIGSRDLNKPDKPLLLEDIASATSLNAHSIQNYLTKLHRRSIVSKSTSEEKTEFKQAVTLTDKGRELYEKACQLLEGSKLI